MQKRHLRKDIWSYLTSSGCVTVLDIIRTVLVAKLLGPYFAGLCITLMVIPQVAQYLNLGSIESLTVFVSQYRARGMVEQAQRLKNNVFNYTIITSGLSTILVMFYATFLSQARPFVNQSTVLAASLIFLWEIKQFFVTHYATERKFLRMSWVEFLFSLLVVIFQLVAVYYSREYGFWLGLIVANLLVIVLSARDYFADNKGWSPSINFSEIKKILPMGLIMTVASVSYAPFIILARIFLAGTRGVHEVGLFLLAIIIISKISTIPCAIAKVVLPHMSYIHGENKYFRPVFDLFAKAQLYTFVVSLFVVAISFFAIQPAVTFFLPQYLAGVSSAKMMLVAAIPYCLVDNANNVLLALEHKRAFVFNLVITLVLQAVTSTVLYATGQINSQAISASLVFVFTCYAALSNFKVFRLKARAEAVSSEVVHA